MVFKKGTLNCCHSSLNSDSEHKKCDLTRVFYYVFSRRSIPVVERSKAWVCGRSLPGIVGSNPARFIIVCRCEGCVLRQARGVLPNVVCLSVIAMRRQ